MKKLFPLTQFTIVFLFFCASTFGQGIKGKVIDADIKEGIVGASVSIENSSYSTSTDLQGNYSLKLPKGDYKLIISFSGYEKKVIPIVVPATAVITMPDISMIESTGATEDEVLILVGSRVTEGRGKNEGTAPVDVISAEQLQSFGQMDLNQILHFLVPAFNSNRQSGSDVSDHVDPTSLRGLGPDQTLVLVNGKRYHQSAVIGVYGTRGRGNTGTDLNSIPVGSIDHIEILRDGAAAQYGSDAIAGVINVVLKSSTKELTGYVNSGIYTEGDGLMINPSLNYGLKIGENGFLNLTGEVLSKAKTLRKADAEFLDANGQLGRTLFGDASYINSSIYLNSEIGLSAKTKFYSTGGLNFRSTEAQGFTVLADSPSNVQSVFPNGYEPRMTSDISDVNLTLGLRTKTNNGWDIDLYNTYGRNGVSLMATNVLNPSQVLNRPSYQTSFDAGGYNLSQNTSGLTFTKNFEKVLSGMNVSMGSEFRIDNYNIIGGEESSWKRYEDKGIIANGGAQNLPGIRPENVVKASRTNFGLYGDVELNITNSWLLATALRYENYSDFGGTLTGKIASRIIATDALSFRGSFSSGFRAPSLAQSFYGGIINDLITDESEQEQYVKRLITNREGNIARAYGIPALKQEESLNASLGLVFQPSKSLSFSLDAYSVKVTDRIVLSGNFPAINQTVTDAFDKLGVISAAAFLNVLDTRTYGVDLVGNYTTTIGEGTLTSSLAFNYNDIEITKINVPTGLEGQEDLFLDRRQRSLVTYAAPKYKVHGLVNYKINKINAGLRVTGFSSMALVDYYLANDEPNRYDPKFTTDLSLGYQLSDKINLMLNGSNIFNVYPSRQNPVDTETGGMYESVQMGFGGSFYSVRLRLKF
jgi:iron complex outermembrane recepter protein